jgi:hypothetical protein
MKELVVLREDETASVKLCLIDSNGVPVGDISQLVGKPRWFSSQPKVFRLGVDEDGINGRILARGPGVGTLTITYQLSTQKKRCRQWRRILVDAKSRVRITRRK